MEKSKIDKEKETVTIMGINLPKWQDCQKCGAKLACIFSAFTYSQPCDLCKDTKEYEDELKKSKLDKATSKRINDTLKSKIPAAYHQTSWGTYLITNTRGDVIGEEKIGAVEAKKNQKAKIAK